MSASTIQSPAPYRPLAFGKKYAVKPRNVADIKTRDIVRFIRDPLRGSAVLELIQSRVDHECGRPRTLRPPLGRERRRPPTISRQGPSTQGFCE